MPSGRRLAAIAAVLTTTTWASAQEYYLDADAGDDANDGLSEATPKRTLASVAGSGFGGGGYEALYLKAGTANPYETGGLSVRSAIVTRYGPESAERPVIAGTGTGFGGVTVGQDGVLAGVKVIGSGRVGISVQGPGAEVRDCEVDGSGGAFELGFGIMGEGNSIHHNVVHHLSAMSGDTGDMNTSGGAEAYMVMASNNEIAYNVALEAHGPNSTLGGSEGGCLEIVNGQAGSTISGVLFHHNYCEQSVGLFEGCSGNFQGTDAIQENHGKIEDSLVAYNISVDAMWLYLLQPVNTDFRNLVFEHNTLVHTPNNHLIEQAARDMFGLNVEEDAGYTGVLEPGEIIVRNNIFAVVQGASTGFGGIQLGNVPDGDHYHNLFVGAAPSWTLGPGELQVDEAAAAFTADYRLGAGSAAIDAGSTLAWMDWTDFDGNPVYLGAAPDIGASEYCDQAADPACSAAQPLDTGSTTGTSTGGDTTPTGGSPAAPAAPGDATADDAGDEGGCGCALVGRTSAPARGALAALALLLLARRRRNPAAR